MPRLPGRCGGTHDLVAATDEQVVGQNVNQHAWISQGLNAAWIEEGRSPRERFLKLTAPVRNADGAIIGVRTNGMWMLVKVIPSQIRAVRDRTAWVRRFRG